MRIKLIRTIALCLAIVTCMCFFPHAFAGSYTFELTDDEKDYIGRKKNIIILGEKNNSPWESYDKERFVGVFPRIFDCLSELTSLNFLYLEPESDNRAQYAIDYGADIISCYAPNAAEESEYSLRLTPAVIKINNNGNKSTLCLAMTKYAGNILYNMISRALNDNRVITLIQSSNVEGGDREMSVNPMYVVVGVFMLALLVLLAVSLRKNISSQTKLLVDNLDELTGLGKKEYMAGCFAHCVTRRNRKLYCMVYIGFGLEQFDKLYKSSESDLAMRHIAISLNKVTTRNDITARIGNDFAILHRFTDKDEVTAWVESIFDNIDTFRARYTKNYNLDVGAGIYYLESTDANFEDVVNKAAQGYIFACDRNTRYAVSDEETRRLVEQAVEDHRHVTEALSNDNFIPYFQPMVDAKTNEIVGVEALARWRHPVSNLIISPSRFISMMEDDNTISTFDFFVFDRLCSILADRHKRGLSPIVFSCNFSRLTFVVPDFEARVMSVLNTYDFPHELLCVELTENTIVDNRAVILKNMSLLRSCDIKIALDDMGSAYTSVFDFKDYCVNIVKMDKKLVDGIDTDKGRELLSGLIAIAHKLGYVVVCESVEQKETVDMVTSMECDIIQGYFFYRPMPYEELEKLIG